MVLENRGTGLVPAKFTGTGPEPVPAQIPPVPNRTGIPVGSYLESHQHF